LLPVCDGKASTVAHDATLPFVVKYLPDWLAWLGTTYTLVVSKSIVTVPDVPPPVKPVPAVTPVMSPALAGLHSSPVVVALLTLKI
jgi:hypothetical protein